MDNSYVINSIKTILETDRILTSFQLKDIVFTINELFEEYVNNNILNISSPNFDQDITQYIYNILIEQLIHLYSNNSRYRVRKKIKKLICRTKQKLYTYIIPYRSYSTSFIRQITVNIEHLHRKIIDLQEIQQSAQRSNEWYEFRHSLLTASSIWKIFGTQSARNQIIFEKCEPYALLRQAPIDSPLHWGQKYEPVSVELYVKLYNTIVSDFGCIKHPIYPFIGASPDGINTDINNPRYGRMLEIKNIVNREITGIPKFEYWIQMQIQMETCDLNECDFLETKFVEYKNEEAFNNDGDFTYTEDGKLKGIMILFSNNGKIHYEYVPLYITKEEYDNWEKHILDINSDMEWIQNIFWKLEKYSNVLVLRNKLWFAAAVSKIQEIWDIIIKERCEGHAHRAPKKRKNMNELNTKKCFIKIEKL